MMGGLSLAPLVPVWALALVGGLIVAAMAYALWRRLRGWPWRAVAALLVLLALANPSLQQEDRGALPNIVLAVVDDSTSQSLGTRPEQTQAALDTLRRQIDGLPNAELREITVTDGEGDQGTILTPALTDALADLPRAQLSGVVIVGDGLVEDAATLPLPPVPTHVLRTGQSTDWDRRISLSNAPAFGILGEPVVLRITVDDLGAAPGASSADIAIAIDGEPAQPFTVPIGRTSELSFQLPHGGINVVQITTPTVDGELTDRNNTAVLRINGLRDRLRVLLVSGVPHPGERTWRNLLKADSAVDLVHFTILRPPEKQDGVPVTELSLIAFPTRELFIDKVDEFDLIIFDRYKRRGILPASYFESIRTYVQNGGAILVAAGPDYASADSLYRTPLGDILPGAPTARVFQRGFVPALSELGARHPVTAGLVEDQAAETWGRWLRQIDVVPTAGQVVMTGTDDRPLLLLDRAVDGRVALLASDHAWLWDRGFEGGGPQLGLLRRLAHWLMQEPDLEEEALTLIPNEAGQIEVMRRSLSDRADPVTLIAPDGTRQVLDLEEGKPGLFAALVDAPALGLYRAEQGDLSAVAAVGPTSPREVRETIATDARITPVLEAFGGASRPLEDGQPSLRYVREGLTPAGRGWLGLWDRAAYEVRDIRAMSLVPPWLFLLLAALTMIVAWLREGRR